MSTIEITRGLVPGAPGDADEGIAAPAPRDDAGLHRAIIAGIVVLLAVAPFVAYPVFVMKVLVFALFALAFNLLLGYGGLLSFGHAAYFGGASYVTAHAIKVWGLDPALAIALGTLAAGALGLAFGALAVRREGIYFAMITLALAQLLYFGALQAPFTGGEDGIQGVPRRAMFGVLDISDDMILYPVVAIIFLAGLLAIYRIIHSPFGAVLKAIRDNEPRAISLGYRTERHKLLVFVLSATLAGLAGATKSVVFQLASLTDVHWSMSGEVVLMTLLGGMGTVFGPILGAFVVVSTQTYLPFLGDFAGSLTGNVHLGQVVGSSVQIVQGLVFVACVLLFREGIAGVIARRTGRGL